MSDEVNLTNMAIREMLMSYYKGDSGLRFAKNSYLNWNPISTPGRRYNYRQTRQGILDERGLVFGSKCLLVVNKNPDTAKFCVDTFKGNAIMQEIQRAIEEVFQKYLKGVKVNYDGKGEPVSAKEAKDWCAKSKYIDQFEQPVDPREAYISAAMEGWSGGVQFYGTAPQLRQPMSFTDAWSTGYHMIVEEADD